MDANSARQWWISREATLQIVTSPGMATQRVTLTMPGSWDAFSVSTDCARDASPAEYEPRLVAAMLEKLGPYRDARFSLSQR